MMTRGLSYYKFGSYYEKLKSKQDEKGASIPPDSLGLETRNAQECMLMLIDDYPYWYNDVPNDYRESNAYKQIKFYSGAPSTQERIRNQNHAEVSFLNGLEKVDSLESTGLEELKKHLIQPAQTIYLTGFMGTGKTMLAEVSAEIFADEYENSDVASNLETIECADTIKDFESLNEWLDFESDASKSKEKLFIFDEAGSHATSLTGKQQAQTYNMLLPLIKQIRKARGRIILIGQSGMDLAKDIRRLSIKIEKESEKRATVYGRGEDGPRLFSLYNIPLPSESYRHDDEREEYADWSWSIDDGETLDVDQSTKDAIIRDIYEQVDSYRVVAEIESDVIDIPSSKQGVKKAVERAD